MSEAFPDAETFGLRPERRVGVKQKAGTADQTEGTGYAKRWQYLAGGHLRNQEAASSAGCWGTSGDGEALDQKNHLGIPLKIQIPGLTPGLLNQNLQEVELRKLCSPSPNIFVLKNIKPLEKSK